MMRKLTTSLFLLLLTFEVSGQETLDLEALKYRYVGPTRGGRVTTVTGVDSRANEFYAGSTGGGLWKSTDYGTTWQNVSDGFFETPSIGAVRVAANDPNIVYAGTGTDGLRSNLIEGKGIYKSVDAGKTWKHVGLRNVGQIGAVEINPQDHNNVFVAAIGNAFAPNAERGVFRTRDGGKSWQKVLFISDTTGFSDLELMPSNPNIIYAAAWRAERKPWTIISGGAENGFYKSVDGGDTWQKTGEGLPTGIVGKIDLAVSAADSRVVYALVEAANKKSGLYRSLDQGETFKLMSDHVDLLNRPFYYTNVIADPQDANGVYVLGKPFWRSEDGGKTWKEKHWSPHGDHHDLWINPKDDHLIIQSNDGGANVSHNRGKSWSSQLNQPTAELYQVEVDNQYPYWLYAGQQDNYTTVSVPSLPPYSHQAGANGYIMNTGGCETGPAVPHPTKPHIVYANCKGRFTVYNKLTGQEKRFEVGAANMYGHNPKDLKFRFQRVSPIHVSPNDPNIIYHTSQFVHKSTDEGKTWEIISPDLTAFEKDKQVISGSPITRDITGEEFYSTIYAIRESKVQAGVIWVGANDGPVHVTQNGGGDWTNVTPKSLPSGGRIDAVEPSPHQAEKAYFTSLRYQLGDRKPYIYKTTNFGKKWTLITNGLPEDCPIRVVREDPDREGLLYAGTEHGLYVSFNDGKNWQKFQQNMPVTPVTDIKIHRKDLVLSTMGRGFWILDNLTPLHQGYDKLKTKTAHLFTPRDAYRYRYSTRFSRQDSSSAPRYPAPAAVIDYYLPEDVEGPVEIHILNEAGKVIRAYNSDRKAAIQSETRDMATNMIRYSINSKMGTKAGLHRFRWDMKHAGPWSKTSKNGYRGGPYAIPGTYTVRLIANGETKEASFKLLQDPKVTDVSLDDLKKQEELSLNLVEMISEAQRKIADIELELKKLKDDDSKKKKELEALKDQLKQSKGSYTQPKLSEQMQYLYRIISTADQVPGKDAFDRYEELKEIWEGMK